MNKKEFLDILEQSLVGEVDRVVIEQNIRFYNEYISSNHDKSEEEIIEEIGDPRLIARTIIETEKIPDQGSFGGNSNYNDRRNYDNSERYQEYRNTSNRNNEYPRIKWYSKLFIIGIMMLLLFILFRAGWILIRMLSFFIVPIIIIALLWYMFRD